MPFRLSNPAARRLFLDRHALAEPPQGSGKGADLLQLIDRLGFVLVDSITTVERAHHMILWSRRPAYKPENLKAEIETHRTLWEHWTHDAAILPTSAYRYWHHRFERDHYLSPEPTIRDSPQCSVDEGLRLAELTL